MVASLAAEMVAPLRVIEATFARASAGWARRQAMEAASAWLDEAGSSDAVLLTTDANTIVRPDWVALNLAAIAAGADAVAGRIALHPEEACQLPDALHARGGMEADYEALLTEIGARLLAATVCGAPMRKAPPVPHSAPNSPSHAAPSHARRQCGPSGSTRRRTACAPHEAHRVQSDFQYLIEMARLAPCLAVQRD